MANQSKELVAFSDLLGDLNLPASVREHLRNHEIWSRWAEIVGSELARVTSPYELKTKILEVSVVHQAWAQQLHFLKPSILGKIRALCPKSQVKELQFRVGKVWAHKAELPRLSVSKSKTPKKIVLTERQEMTLRAVEDPELRKVIRSAMEAEADRRSED